MIIELAKLKEGPVRLQGEDPASALDLEPDALIQPAGPIRYTVTAELTPGELVVRGSLAVRIACDCSRCAKKLESDVKVPDFIAVKEYRDLTEAIDLTPDVREDIILAFPNYPVCSPGCRGLCPRCGADLNRETCSCKPPGGNQTWDALDQLTKKTE